MHTMSAKKTTMGWMVKKNIKETRMYARPDVHCK